MLIQMADILNRIIAGSIHLKNIEGVILVCLIAFFLGDGRELIYAIYIPLDFLLDLGTLVFYLV